MMRKKNIFRCSAVTVLSAILGAAEAHAASHLWRFNEIFSNADGTIQFVELKECCGATNETFIAGKWVKSDATAAQYNFPVDLTPPTSNKYLLLATSGFAALPGAPTPDFIMQNNFLGMNGDTLRYWLYGDATMTYGPGALPTNGILSLSIGGGTAVNSPTNYAGQSGSVNAVCIDGDGDGYGNPGDASCPNGSATDCNDGNDQIHPGVTESGAACADLADNDCDSLTDCLDPGCFSDPACCACNADVNGSGGTPNFTDMSLVVNCIQGLPICDPGPADVNCDGQVGPADLGVVVHEFRGEVGTGCEVVLGACCQKDGTCWHEQQSMCDGDPLFPQFAGVYQGDGTTCSTNPCDMPEPPIDCGDDTCHDGLVNTGVPCCTDADCILPTVCGNKRYLTVHLQPQPPGIDRTIQIEIVNVLECNGGSRAGRGCTTASHCPGGTCMSSSHVGQKWWAAAEQSIANPPRPPLRGARVVCEPTPSHAQVWPEDFYLFGSPIVPGAKYNVRVCNIVGENCSEPPLLLSTSIWGDLVPVIGTANFADASALVDKFRFVEPAPDMTRADLAGTGDPGEPSVVNQVANFADVAADVDAIRGFAFPNITEPCP